MRFDEHPFEQMNRLFRETSGMMWNSPLWSGSGGFRGLPPFTQAESFSVRTVEDGYVVMADLPGFEKDDLDIRFDDGVLTIRGVAETVHDSRADDSADDEAVTTGEIVSADADWPVSVRAQGRQRREVYEQLTLPGTVIEDEITANYRNGVLEIELPTEEGHDETDAHRIDIE